MIAVNALSGSAMLGGRSVGEISAIYPAVFTPAGITFSIWGVIFLWLLVFVVYQARDIFSSNQQDMPFLEQISFWFIVANVANTAWIFAWTNELIFLSLVLIVTLFISLLAIYIRLQVGAAPVSRRDKWLVHNPFRIYLGWISVATIANVTVLLVAQGVPAFDANGFLWGAIMTGVGALLGVIILLRRADIAYGLVIVWAIFGIFLKQTELSAPEAVWVRYTAIAGIGALMAAIIITLMRLIQARRQQVGA